MAQRLLKEELEGWGQLFSPMVRRRQGQIERGWFPLSGPRGLTLPSCFYRWDLAVGSGRGPGKGTKRCSRAYGYREPSLNGA